MDFSYPDDLLEVDLAYLHVIGMPYSAYNSVLNRYVEIIYTGNATNYSS